MRADPYGGRERRGKATWRGQRRNIEDVSHGRGALVNTAYKRKGRKVRPVDATDRTGEGPGGRSDWYKRSKERETP